MREYKHNSYSVLTDLPPGVYNFEAEPEVRNKLYEMLEVMWLTKQSVYAYNYKDFRKSINLRKHVIECNAELVVLNDAGDYIQDIVEDVMSLSNSCVVLINHEGRFPIRYDCRVVLQMLNELTVLITK